MKKRRLTAVKKKKHRVLSFVVLFVPTLLICLTFIYLRKGQEEEYAEKLAQQKRLERMIAEEQKRAETITDYRAYVQTKSYIEELAREVLGLVYKNEVIFRAE